MRDEVLDTFKKWLHVEDEDGIDLIFATAIASMIPGDPIWLFVVDPPGATKTEICRAFTGPHVYSVDWITPQSLISGFRSKKGVSIDILPDLDGKLLVIKDFTTILQKPDKTKDDLFSTLRAAYDGELAVAFGSGVKRKAVQSRFGILAAVTQEIDHYYKVHTLLGERFLKLRPLYDRKQAVKSAIKHSGQEIDMREEISEVIKIALDFYKLKAKNPRQPSDDTAKKVEALADLTAILRTGIPRGHGHQVRHEPEAEVGTRLGKQFIRVAQSLLTYGAYSYSKIVRLAEDTVPKPRMKMIRALQHGALNTTDLVAATKMPKFVIHDTGEELHLLGVIERSLDSDTYVHELIPEFKQDMEIAHLGCSVRP